MSARKKCTRCGQEKDVGEFPKDKRGKYGVRAKCRPCFNEYCARLQRIRRAENPERDRERRKDWRNSPAGRALVRKEIEARSEERRRTRPEREAANYWAREARKQDRLERRATLRAVKKTLTTSALRHLRLGTRDGECLISHLTPGRRGYAKTQFEGRYYAIHRLIYEGWYGELSPGTPVHHTCANRLCIEPSHLQAVTPQENMAEMLERRVYRERIAKLEAALAVASPNHPLLSESESSSERA